MKKHNEAHIKGIRIRTFNAVIVALACVLYAFLVYATITESAKYSDLIKYTKDHIEMKDTAVTVQNASDFLTEQVRLYAQNMDLEYAEAYFEEVNVSKNRDKALEKLQNYHYDEILNSHMEAAVDASNKLMEREIYSMKLISDANGYEDKILPEEIREVSLTSADANLSSDKMIEKARIMVFDKSYQNEKEIINIHLANFTEGVVESADMNFKNGAEGMTRAIWMQRILIMLLVIMNIVTFVVIVKLVIKPLRQCVESVKAQTPFDIQGSYEFKYLSHVYNRMYQQKLEYSAKSALMKYNAEHDPLTGIRNRNVFERVTSLLKQNDTPLALLMMDVDLFKEINDKYGHETGDRVLKKVAHLLQENFRLRDYVFRIGGDEFAGLMMNVNEQHSYLINEKITKINEILANSEDGLPATSLSVGVAFSKSGYYDELYAHADQALYKMKKDGRCGCRFYENMNQKPKQQDGSGDKTADIN